MFANRGSNSSQVGYWSRTAKSILHEDCYNLSGINARKNQDLFNNKTIKSQKNGDRLLTDFITQRENKERCFICNSQIDFHDSLILTLLKLEKNIKYQKQFFVQLAYLAQIFIYLKNTGMSSQKI